MSVGAEATPHIPTSPSPAGKAQETKRALGVSPLEPIITESSDCLYTRVREPGQRPLGTVGLSSPTRSQ